MVLTKFSHHSTIREAERWPKDGYASIRKLAKQLHQEVAHLEEQKARGAIKTDFILSAEIMTIALAEIPESTIWMEAATLAVVAIGITVLVYGSVALLVKADDFGLMLTRRGRLSSRSGRLDRRSGNRNRRNGRVLPLRRRRGCPPAN